MARPARGHEFVDAAITQAAQAKTISELRMAQALLLPLKFGLSLDDTSVAVGRSKSWTLRLRKRFGRIQSGQEQSKIKQGLRNRARMTLEEEAVILALFLEQAKEGGVIVMPLLRAKLEHAVERPLAVSTVYAMLHRDGWRLISSTCSQTRPLRTHRKKSPTLSPTPARHSSGPHR